MTSQQGVSRVGLTRLEPEHNKAYRPTRRSTFDSILAGCVPVFFEELSAKKQYVWHLPEDEYDEFSVMIPEEDVVFKGVSVLKGIPKGRVRKMRKKLIEMIPRIVYRMHRSSLGLRNQKDAFDIADIAVEGTFKGLKLGLKVLVICDLSL
nr:probable xyloglucan galactosyltransferase GT19 [Tanacetum cinerariifolium]